MQNIELTAADIEKLIPLHTAYKREIGEDVPTKEDFISLAAAIDAGIIRFFGCEEDGRLLGCCSIAPTWSTFNYASSGVFEDFYVLPEFRHRGIARALVHFAVECCGVSSLTVGCADCDVDMYKALGFSIPLGNLQAYEM